GGRFTSGGQPKKQHHQRNLWTRGSGEGTEAPSPDEEYERNNNIADFDPSCCSTAAAVDAIATTAFPRVLIPKYNGSGGAGERTAGPVRLRRQPFLLSDFSGSAPRGTATKATAAEAAAMGGAACCRIDDPSSTTTASVTKTTTAAAVASAETAISSVTSAATASPLPGTPVEGVSSDDSWPNASARRGLRAEED
ncbi:unnamed protein product, partial [Laminaria digitata]